MTVVVADLKVSTERHVWDGMLDRWTADHLLLWSAPPAWDDQAHAYEVIATFRDNPLSSPDVE